MDDVVIHRESTPLDSDPVRPWLASLPRVLERSCACLSPESAVAMLDFVTTNHLCDIAELHIPSFGPTSSRLQQAIKHSVRGSRSILETCARLQLEDAGIRVQVGVPIPGVGEVDMIVFDRLIIELDGWAFHKDKLQRARDLERDRRLVELGFLVVRFEYEAVMTNCTFVSEVLAMRDHALALERPALDYSSWSFL
ncbi:endonuclease domain-containing protein [Schaalia vaccimaxillae]|uniref:endonuclease domain-containing protein n=1 Tax=Schaalia vaccimaxillae TaxID=183916 RepID=UPI0013F4095C|nr:DUF559 domain-containing protein [Schaalia vaccimaxillae]